MCVIVINLYHQQTLLLVYLCSKVSNQQKQQQVPNFFANLLQVRTIIHEDEQEISLLKVLLNLQAECDHEKSSFDLQVRRFVIIVILLFSLLQSDGTINVRTNH